MAQILALTVPFFAQAELCPDLYSALDAKEAGEKIARLVALNADKNHLRPLLRTLDDARIEDLNGGNAFPYRFDNAYTDYLFGYKTKAIGKQIRYRDGDGKEQSLKIIAPNGWNQALQSVVESVRTLPVDALPATKTIEILPYRLHRIAGYANNNFFALSADQVKEIEVIRHEFGHNVAKHIWGTMNPLKEWRKAFAADNAHFNDGYIHYVSYYAKASDRKKLRPELSEDFADSVAMYLHNDYEFRLKYPNRAALLDTVFRDPTGSPFRKNGVWQPLRSKYNSPAHRALMFYVETPVASTAMTLIAVPLGGALTMLGGNTVMDVWNDSGKPKESFPKPLAFKNEYKSAEGLWDEAHYKRLGFKLHRNESIAKACIQGESAEAMPLSAELRPETLLIHWDTMSAPENGEGTALVLTDPNGTIKFHRYSERPRVAGITELEIPNEVSQGEYLIHLCTVANGATYRNALQSVRLK